MYRSYVDKLNRTFGTSSDVKVEPNEIIDITTDSIWCVGLTSQRPICIFAIDFYIGMAR